MNTSMYSSRLRYGQNFVSLSVNDYYWAPFQTTALLFREWCPEGGIIRSSTLGARGISMLSVLESKRRTGCPFVLAIEVGIFTYQKQKCPVDASWQC